MSNRLKIAAMAVVVAFPAIGCLAAAEPTPMPTATPDVGAMVRAAMATAFAPTPTPTPDIQAMVEAAVDATLAAAATPEPIPTATPTLRPTYTPAPIPATTPTRRPIYTPVPIPAATPTRHPTYTPVPTTTPAASRLQEVECGPPCYTDYEPILPPVDWISPPKISETGVIELVAVLDDDVDMGALGTANGGQFTVTDTNNILYGTIVAPIAPGWEWTPEPGLWVAEQFTYVANTLRVRAQIDPAAVTHPGLRLCLWSGGAWDESSLLDCVLVRQP